MCVCVCCVGEEAGKLDVLEGQWRAALNKYRHKKKQVTQFGEDMQVENAYNLPTQKYDVYICNTVYQTMQRRLNDLNSERADLEVKLEARQSQMASLQRELSDLKAKRSRLSKQVQLLHYNFTNSIIMS